MVAKQTKIFVLTGLVAWVGGVGTAVAVSSCDIDTCSDGSDGRMDPNDPDCFPQPLESEPVSVADGGGSSIVKPPDRCDNASHASVHVVPVRTFDDYSMVVPVEMVWFRHEGKTYEARCLHDDEGCIGGWVAGYELEGPIEVSTEYCDTVVSQTVTVGRTDDGCHVATVYMLLEVSTRGCLRDAEPPTEPPPPEPPWRLVAPESG